MDQIDRALANGIRVSAWTFDELYTRDSKFLDGLESRGQVFVSEMPANSHGWLKEPTVRPKARKTAENTDDRESLAHVSYSRKASDIRDLVIHSRVFNKQKWQPYHIKDTDKGPEVWNVKWAPFWRKDSNGLPTRRHCMIYTRNVLTGEIKFFLSNRVPSERNPVTGKKVSLRWLLRVAFGRCSIESCFREAKEELGLDHYEVRGWRCVHRHFYVTQLSHLFCARVRQEYDDAPAGQVDRISVEQVRSAMNVWLDAADLPPRARRERYIEEQNKQEYYQRRNRQARESHTKTRIGKLKVRRIDVSHIKSCINKGPGP